jgi:hypothetical protein
MQEILVHPFMKEFFSKKEVVEASEPIIISIDDNKKLSLKDYRALIYDLVSDYE